MAFWTLLLISFGLSMDAVAVTASSTVGLRGSRAGQAFRLAVTFGLFQLIMATLGWIAGVEVVRRIARWDHWIAFILLALIGGKMIYDGIRGHEEETSARVLTYAALFVLGVATSIDSLAAGVTLPMLQLPLGLSVAVIGLVTFALSFAAGLAASRIGESGGEKLEILGGVVLILIGVKIVLER